MGHLTIIMVIKVHYHQYFHLFGILKIHNNLTKKHDIVLKSLKPQRDSNLHMTCIGKKTFINYTWFNCLLQQELRHNMGVSHTTLKRMILLSVNTIVTYIAFPAEIGVSPLRLLEKPEKLLLSVIIYYGQTKQDNYFMVNVFQNKICIFFAVISYRKRNTRWNNNLRYLMIQ